MFFFSGRNNSSKDLLEMIQSKDDQNVSYVKIIYCFCFITDILISHVSKYVTCFRTVDKYTFSFYRIAFNAKNGLYDILREFMSENENLK